MKKHLKYILVSVVFLHSHFLFSQSDGERINRKSLGIVFTPQFSNWYYKSTPEYQWVVDYYDSVFIHKNGLSIGIILEYDINSTFAVKTGLQFSYYPYETIILEANVDDPLFPCGHFSFEGTDYFLDLPLLLKYDLLKTNRLIFFLSGGIINKFLFYERTKSYSECFSHKNRELIGKSGNFTKSFIYFIAASIEAGINISITDRIYTGLYPSFEYSFYSNMQKNDFNRCYYLFGLNISVAYKF